MIALNIDANTQEQKILKSYLEQNVSEVLAEKINNGTPIEKDGKQFVSKKTLDGFMTFACDEAKKLAEKGARGACIEDKTVFGWAIHYFEEDSIEGTLYNLDGTEYKQPKPKYEPKAKPPTAPPKPKEQLSLFDLMDECETENPKTEIKPTKQVDTKKTQAIPEKPKGSPLYQRYEQLQRQYPMRS